MKKETQDYIERILRLLIEKLPQSNPNHKFWIEPTTNKLALDIFIGNTIQTVTFEHGEEQFDNPDELVNAIFDDLRKSGYQV
jgi:hypothetical protein